MEHVIIGVDPHKISATIEVVDQHEQLLGAGRFTTDRAGYSHAELREVLAGPSLGGRRKQRRGPTTRSTAPRER